MNLVVQTFGSENEYRRAVLTVLSFFAHVSEPKERTTVFLFTDRPEYFENYLGGMPVHYVLLTDEKIRGMRGSIDFLHRMKIAVIEEAFLLANGNILYADSDTFFINDPAPLMNNLAGNTCYMHLHEYQFGTLKNRQLPAGKTFHNFLEILTSTTFQLANGRAIKFTPQHSSWNAGVMMLHFSQSHYIPDVYALTNQFYPLTQNHASEQYAFSLMLQEHVTIYPCDSVIYHYWYRVKKQIMDAFLVKRMDAKWSQADINKKLEDIKEWTNLMPAYFEEHVWTIKDNAIQAFNVNNYKQAYKWAIKAMMKRALFSDKAFLKHLAYHTKRLLIKH
jgi:hypothetical protein